MSENTRGALWMMGSMLGFVINDTIMKLQSDEIPLFQAIFIRGVFSLVLISALAWSRGVFRHRPTRSDRVCMALRMGAEVATTMLYLNALFHMPIGNAVAILQVSSLGVTLAASVFLGDRVGWRRYTAIAAGFIGVLLIVRPGTEGFNTYSLSAMAAVIGIIVRDLSTRSMSAALPGLLVTTFTAGILTLTGAIGTLLTGWVPVTVDHLMAFAAAAVCIACAYYSGVAAMRVGEIGAVSPFRYVNLVQAMILGLIVFGDVPDALTLVGAAIIAASGIYTLYRERVLPRTG